MSRFSSQKNTASFNKHQVYDVATSLTESKYIANDLADAKRYQYRATLTVVGNSAVKPYEAVYLDGLPDDLSGYWTVLSVKHIFGGTVANYLMELEVGTDTLGQTSDTARNAVETRDVSGELSGQALIPSKAQLKTNSFEVNTSPLTPTYGKTQKTSVVTQTVAKKLEAIDPKNPYSVTSPKPGNVRRSNSWEAR